jgi:hypothetical protein
MRQSEQEHVVLQRDCEGYKYVGGKCKKRLPKQKREYKNGTKRRIKPRL